MAAGRRLLQLIRCSLSLQTKPSLSLQTKPPSQFRCQSSSSSSSSNQRRRIIGAKRVNSNEVGRISNEKLHHKPKDSSRRRRRIPDEKIKIGKEFWFPSHPRSYLDEKFLNLKPSTSRRARWCCYYEDVVAEYLADSDEDDEFKSPLGLEGRASNIKKGDPVDVVSLLFPELKSKLDDEQQQQQQQDLLVRINNGGVVSPVLGLGGLNKKRYLLCFCFLVPTFWEEEYDCDHHHTWNIVKATSELKKKSSWRHAAAADDFEMLVVVKMRRKWGEDADAFYHFFSGFPDCLAVPFENQPARDRICDLLLCSGGKPTSLIVDLVIGKVLQYGDGDACQFWGTYGADAFPFTDERLQTLDAQQWQLLDGLEQGPSLQQLLSPCTHLSKLVDDKNNNTEEIPIQHLNDKLVGLYLCFNGSLMGTLDQVHSDCKQDGLELEIVVVYAPFFVCRDPTLLQQYVDQILKNGTSEISDDWWVLRPFTDSVSRRLLRLDLKIAYGLSHDKEKLIMVGGPKGEYWDPYGGEVLQHRDFGGVDAFPFTRNSVIEREVKRLRAIRLDQVLVSGPSQDYLLPKLLSSERIPVETLRNKVVLVYFCTMSATDHYHPMEDHVHPDLERLEELYPWFVSLKEAHPDDFEIVLLAVGCSPSKLSCSRCYGMVSRMPWLVCPFDRDHSAFVVERIFKTNFVSWYANQDGFMAFGKDGYLCSIYPSDFPFNDEDMRTEVLSILTDQYEELFHSLYYYGHKG